MHRLAVVPQSLLREPFRVAGQEFSERFIQDPAIGQLNRSIGTDGFNRDKLAIRGPATGPKFAVAVVSEGFLCEPLRVSGDSDAAAEWIHCGH